MEGENQYKKGLWTEEEDKILMDYVKLHGKGQWNRTATKTGLKRCGKSCRLRWMNYLSPNVKRGSFTDQEDDLIIRLHRLLGNRWSLIAGRVPGRTDNQVKNYWNSHLCKKLGLNKNKPALGVSGLTDFRAVKKAPAVPPTSSKSNPYCCSSSSTEAIIETQTSKITPEAVVVEASHKLEVVTSEGFSNDFWASSDQELELSLMQFWDDFSFDLVWNDLYRS